MRKLFLLLLPVACSPVLSEPYFAESLPRKFDLRNVGGQVYVSAVKNQSGGTCWTHGTMAAVEGNLMRTGTWKAAGESGEANLAEYHLDWWNGFNRHFNSDISPKTGGLTVHQGGDYRVAAAYFSRGGAVRDEDAQSYNQAPKQSAEGYHTYYARDIEWLAGPDDHRDRIKQALMEHGAVGTALAWSDEYFNSGSSTFYEPQDADSDANHAVAIVGWDDDKKTGASEPGAWLVKNSWGPGWGQKGFFWISYFDKISGHHADMGAVSFQRVERLKYKNVYFHDYHGWRDTKSDAREAFNAFTAKGNETLSSVSFYTTTDDTTYAVKVFTRFENGQLDQMVSFNEGVIANRGFHTVDLSFPWPLKTGEKFYIYVRVDRGGQALDRTSEVPVLLGSRYRTIVESKAAPGESYFRKGNAWVDLTTEVKTGNFCIKALTTD